MVSYFVEWKGDGNVEEFSKGNVAVRIAAIRMRVVPERGRVFANHHAIIVFTLAREIDCSLNTDSRE